MSIPLCLTSIRLFLSPLFIILYIYHEAMGIDLTTIPYILIFVVLLAELSDIFDGQLARKYNQVTELGKLFDPMADTIFRLSMFFTFTQGIVKLPLLLVFVFFYREMIISTLRTICALRGVALAARLSGKIKAVLQAIIGFFILFLMIPYSLGYISLELLREISFYSVLVGACYTVFTGFEYIIANKSYIKKAIAH
jgi:CDP-diacylglycerol---glycerol-3-phosphate 3-phosphatidyltransferase